MISTASGFSAHCDSRGEEGRWLRLTSHCRARGLDRPRRADNWWVQPLVVFLGLSAFIVYSTWAAMQGRTTDSARISRLFIRRNCLARHGWFGQSRPGCPRWVTGAMLILWAPGGFRVTCYYYRGAYYKAFWADPPSCTVGEPRKTYLGERSFPSDHAEHSPLLSCIWRCCSLSFSAATCGMPFGLTATSASASARWSCLPTSCC